MKSLTLGVEAFLFEICRSKLLEMQWFGNLYSIVLDVRAWASTLVRPLKARAMDMWRRARDYAESFMKKDGGELLRQIARLRDAVRQKPPA